MKTKINGFLLAALLSVQMSALQALEIPVVGVLLGAGGGGNPGLETLGALLPGPGLATFTAVPALVLDLLDPAVVTSLVLEGGIPLLPGFVPVLDVLLTAPLSLPSYLLDGGILVSPSLTLVPELPLLSAPLPGL